MTLHDKTEEGIFGHTKFTLVPDNLLMNWIFKHIPSYMAFYIIASYRQSIEDSIFISQNAYHYETITNFSYGKDILTVIKRPFSPSSLQKWAILVLEEKRPQMSLKYQNMRKCPE